MGILFTKTSKSTVKLALLLNYLGINSTCINGKLTHSKRMAAINEFKLVLVTTDVVARGLDIHLVDLVINYHVPESSIDYIHRVGRTARANRNGEALTFVTQYDIDLFRKLEL